MVMPMRSGRALWIAAIIAIELAGFWYFLRHAPSSTSNAEQSAQLRRRQSSANVRRCLSERDRDARFVRRGECVTVAQRVAAIEDLLFELARVLDALEIDYWLDSGSLLGQYRTGGVVPWDVNGDVGVLLAGLHTLRSTRVAIPAGYELNVADSALYASADRDTQIPARWVDTTHGFYVNVYAFTETAGTTDRSTAMLAPAPGRVWDRCAHCEFVADAAAGDVKRFAVPRDWIFPLHKCAFASFASKCPAQPQQYLTHLYGEGFREPVLWQ